jgi:hypothetical protein
LCDEAQGSALKLKDLEIVMQILMNILRLCDTMRHILRNIDMSPNEAFGSTVPNASFARSRRHANISAVKRGAFVRVLNVDLGLEQRKRNWWKIFSQIHSF